MLTFVRPINGPAVSQNPIGKRLALALSASLILHAWVLLAPAQLPTATATAPLQARLERTGAASGGDGKAAEAPMPAAMPEKPRHAQPVPPARASSTPPSPRRDALPVPTPLAQAVAPAVASAPSALAAAVPKSGESVGRADEAAGHPSAVGGPTARGEPNPGGNSGGTSAANAAVNAALNAGGGGGEAPPPDALRAYTIALGGSASRLRRYPPLARERGWEGRVEVAVTLLPGLAVPRVGLRRGCGHELLDEQALEIVRGAVAAVPLPEALRGRSAAVRLPIEFSLAGE